MTTRASITVTPLKFLVANNPFAMSLFLELVFAPITATSRPLFVLPVWILNAGFSDRLIRDDPSPSAGRPGLMNSGTLPSWFKAPSRLVKSRLGVMAVQSDCEGDPSR